MQYRSVLWGVAMVAAMAWPLVAAADVIYDNGGPAYEDQYSPMISDRDFYHEIADNFVLGPGANTITDVHWWGVYSSEPPGAVAAQDDFLIRIFADVEGTPDTKPLLAIDVTSWERVDTGIDLVDLFEGISVYSYSAVFDPIELTAGTTYWISITNDTTSDTDVHWWWMAHATSGGNTVHRTVDGNPWVTFGGYESAFQLTNNGVVPEPASLSLLGLGVAGLAAGATRRRR